MSVPLATLFARSLSYATKAFGQPTADDSTQDLIRLSLTDLTTLRSRVAGLSLFSPNETLEDISTKDLVYLLVPYVYAEVQGRVQTTEREDRMASLDLAQRFLREFLLYLENYEIIPDDEYALHEQKTSVIKDPGKRRALKITQYQKEKDLRVRLEAICKRRSQIPLDADNRPSDFDLISTLLPLSFSSRSAHPTVDHDEAGPEMDDVLREATLLLLRLSYAQAHSQLESMDQELELLCNVPPISAPSPSQPGKGDRRGKGKQSESDIWKLDASSGNYGPDGQGPLLDPVGKPLRPFTILPSDTATRARLQAQVFGPGHKLPTMSVDEYLQTERERGNIISGGGTASRTAPTSSELLTFESEMDGTRDGEAKAEAKRLKDENWARFTDENQRGAGNTMNRG